MRINHNIPALRTLHQMNRTNSKIDKTMQRLSSGLRINSAADDAAGLAIAQKMDTQVRGLQQANRNAMDGISLIQTAEGALNEVHSMLQRTRELSIQASNGTLTASDRKAITDEVNQLKAEIDRISQHIEYNEKKLLNGEIDRRAFSTENKLGNVVSMSDGVDPGDYTFEVEQAATKTTLQSEAETGLFTILNDVDKAARQTAIDGLKATADGFKTIADGLKATADGLKATADGLKTTADGLKATADGLKAIADASGDLADITAYNAAKVAYDAAKGAYDAAKVPYEAAKVEYELAAKVYDAAAKTHSEAVDKLAEDTSGKAKMGGVININGEQVEIKVGDDPQTVFAKLRDLGDTMGIDIAVEGNVPFGNGAKINIVHREYGVKEIKIEGDVDLRNALGLGVTHVKNNTKSGDEIKIKDGSWKGFPAGVTHSTKGNMIVFEATKGFKLTIDGAKSEYNEGDLTNGTVDGMTGDVTLSLLKTGPLDLQIGANEGQMMQLRIQNMSTAALGLDNMNLNTADKSQEAITLVDAAIAQVSSTRSKLGAYQNRLEHTVANLDVAAENMTASKSRIQDADMAKEMADYTKDNILAQAGNAMLAQANQRPQQILQLLQ